MRLIGVLPVLAGLLAVPLPAAQPPDPTMTDHSSPASDAELQLRLLRARFGELAAPPAGELACRGPAVTLAGAAWRWSRAVLEEGEQPAVNVVLEVADGGAAVHLCVDTTGRALPCLRGGWVIEATATNLSSFHREPAAMRLALRLWPAGPWLMQEAFWRNPWSPQRRVLREGGEAGLATPEELLAALPAAEFRRLLASCRIAPATEALRPFLDLLRAQDAVEAARAWAAGLPEVPAHLAYALAATPTAEQRQAVLDACTMGRPDAMELALDLAAERRDAQLLDALAGIIDRVHALFGLEDPPAAAMDAHMKLHQRWVEIRDRHLTRARRRLGG